MNLMRQTNRRSHLNYQFMNGLSTLIGIWAWVKVNFLFMPHHNCDFISHFFSINLSLDACHEFDTFWHCNSTNEWPNDFAQQSKHWTCQTNKIINFIDLNVTNPNKFIALYYLYGVQTLGFIEYYILCVCVLKMWYHNSVGPIEHHSQF